MKIYHNNRCRKSREGVQYLMEKGIEFKIIDYMKENISENKMKELLIKLNISAIDLIRKNEKIWKDNYKGGEFTCSISSFSINLISGQENKIMTYIENEISRVGMESFIEQILVPSEKVVQIRNGKKVTKDKTYFPGYIMIKANLTGEVPHIIKSVTNVIGFLGETKGGDPIPLRQNEVNRMLGKVDELSLQEESDIVIPFIHGENVKVIDGPFNGFDGTIEKINEEKRKLEVMVKIFGRKTPLELNFMQVEKE